MKGVGVMINDTTALMRIGVALGDALKESDANISGEVLSGNIVKENYSRGVSAGIRIAINIIQTGLADLSPERLTEVLSETRAALNPQPHNLL